MATLIIFIKVFKGMSGGFDGEIQPSATYKKALQRPNANLKQ
jgi:hypothetical protein